MRSGKKIYQAFLIIAAATIASGIAFAQDRSQKGRPVTIGLLIQDNNWSAAVHGAELAVINANNNGGLNGLVFQLVVRSMEGPWGTGSKQAVDLIFREKAWALIGLHDGRNAHLVEQAATKSQVVFLSAWSADPTLSQAFVPWFFNCVPNDNQQAESLFREIYELRKYRNIVVICGSDYDSQKSHDSFMNVIKISGKPYPLQFNLEGNVQETGILAEKVKKSDADCMVLFCTPAASLELIRLIKENNPVLQVFSPLSVLNENELSARDLKSFDNILSVPSGEWPEAEHRKFSQEFKTKYGYDPGVAAAYSFDAMSVLIEAVRQAGKSDYELIQKSLKNIQFNGVTGTVRFDDKGNRIGKFEIKKTKDGVPVFPD